MSQAKRVNTIMQSRAILAGACLALGLVTTTASANGGAVQRTTADAPSASASSPVKRSPAEARRAKAREDAAEHRATVHRARVEAVAAMLQTTAVER